MSGQELELQKAVEKQASLEKLVREFHEADQIEKEAGEQRKALREEILVEFTPGAHVCGGYMVEVKAQNRRPTIDWLKEFLATNGEQAVEEAKLRHKDCTEGRPVYNVSVKPLAK